MLRHALTVLCCPSDYLRHYGEALEVFFPTPLLPSSVCCAAAAPATAPATASAAVPATDASEEVDEEACGRVEATTEGSRAPFEADGIAGDAAIPALIPDGDNGDDDDCADDAPDTEEEVPEALSDDAMAEVPGLAAVLFASLIRVLI